MIENLMKNRMNLPEADAATRRRNSRMYIEGCDGECIVCGRPLKTDNPRVLCVELADGGGSILEQNDDDTPDAELNDGGYMGVYYVGSECAKRIPKEFKYKNT